MVYKLYLNKAIKKEKRKEGREGRREGGREREKRKKTESIVWEKIFVRHLSDRKLIAKIKNSYNLIMRRQLNKTWAKT